VRRGQRRVELEHAITAGERARLYMQGTWIATKDGGVPFSDVPLKIFSGIEPRA
jgi:hypothetical protein